MQNALKMDVPYHEFSAVSKEENLEKSVEGFSLFWTLSFGNLGVEITYSPHPNIRFAILLFQSIEQFPHILIHHASYSK